jgi:hypothetical protein
MEGAIALRLAPTGSADVFRGGKRMNGNAVKGIRWGSVVLGWLVAAVVGSLLSLLFGGLYGLVDEASVEGGEITAGFVVISLVSGFLAYLAGGFMAGRSAGHSGGLNGAMTAVFGLILGLVVGATLAVLGVTFAQGVAMPPANFGLVGGVLLAGLLLFLVNLFGGYVGGKLGEPSRPEVRRFR